MAPIWNYIALALALVSSIKSIEFEGYKFNQNITESTRFLIYDVNPGEGFNLRRDVYVRVANLIRKLNDRGESWVLVLHPWRHLYHWKTRYLRQEALQWKNFFDLQNMNLYVPVMEFKDFIENYATEPNTIDEVMYLQHHPDGFKGGWKELIERQKCSEPQSKRLYWKSKGNNGKYEGWFWGISEIRAQKFGCISAQGHASILADFLKKTSSRSILVDRFETLLHTDYGSVDFYKARRSLVFAKHLREVGDEYRLKYLDSDDVKDKTPYAEDDWRKQIPVPESALGGPYIGLHMRRGDFTYAHNEINPTIEEIGNEVERLLKKYKLHKVYVSTDGTHEELDELQSYIKTGKIYQIPRPKEIIQKYKDGGVAIIDQWIVAHARYFLGTCQSTFSFRIEEERQILGFPAEMTYNCKCGQQADPERCSESSSSWRVKFG